MLPSQHNPSSALVRLILGFLLGVFVYEIHAFGNKKEGNQPQSPIVKTKLLAAKHLSTEDAKLQLRADDLKPSTGFVTDGFSNQSRVFVTQNQTKNPYHFLIEHAFTSVDAYIITQSNAVYKAPKCPGVTFPCFKVNTGEHLVLRVSAVLMNLKYFLRPQAENFAHEADRQMYFGIYFGIVCIMILYNISLWIGQRRREFLLLSVYAVGNGIVVLSLSGEGSRLFWPHVWQDFMIILGSNGFMLASVSHFFLSFLGKETFKYHLSIARTLGLVNLGVIPLCLFPEKTYSIIAMNSLLLITAIFNLAVLAIATYKKNKRGILLLSSFLPSCLAAMLISASNFGLFAPSTFLEQVIPLSFACQISLLSLILADDMRQMQRKIYEGQVALASAKQERLAAILEKIGFVAVKLADRLNTPLQSIQFCSHLLRKSIGPSDSAKKEEVIQIVASKLNNSVRDIKKEMARLEGFRDFAPQDALEKEIDLELSDQLFSENKDEAAS